MKPFDVAVIDYGMGNIRSVFNACTSLGASCLVATSPEELPLANRLVLPGVGAFGDAMRLLNQENWAAALQREVQTEGKPLLGVCLGMQLLANRGTEYGVHQGLGLIEGEVVKIPHPSPQQRVPHIGWNDVQIVSAQGIYAGFEEMATFYFVHSFAFCPRDASVVTAWCEHGGRWAASLQQKNIFGVQFHPEKSQSDGLGVLRNFLAFSRQTSC